MRKGGVGIFLWRLLCAFLATAVIVLFWQNKGLINILILALAILSNLKSTKIEVFYYIIVAVLATIVESVAMSSGAWTYAQQDILNFPIWLPLYWGMGGMVMKDIFILMKQPQK
jgi:uncharacterized membrane protein